MSIDLTEVFRAEREQRAPNEPGRVYRETLHDRARPLVIAGDCWLIAYTVELGGDEETFYVYAGTRRGAIRWIEEHWACIEPIAADGESVRFWLVGKRFRRLASLTYQPPPPPPLDPAAVAAEWLAWCREGGEEEEP